MEVLKQRFIVTVALETTCTVEDGIVVIDLCEAESGSILGFSFAPYAGGALPYIDGMGVKNFVALAENLSETFYGRFDPYASLGEGGVSLPGRS